jgi:hypothetical protein
MFEQLMQNFRYLLAPLGLFYFSVMRPYSRFERSRPLKNQLDYVGWSEYRTYNTPNGPIIQRTTWLYAVFAGLMIDDSTYPAITPYTLPVCCSSASLQIRKATSFFARFSCTEQCQIVKIAWLLQLQGLVLLIP